MNNKQPKRGRPSIGPQSHAGSNLKRMRDLVNQNQIAHERPTASRSTKTKAPVAPILPREPLTRKARAAIEVYAIIRHRTKFVDAILKAERMRRADLYKVLEGAGYRWNTKLGWRKKQ